MATIKLKINERTGKGKEFMQFLKEFLKDDKSIEILEEKSPYNPEFVKMVKKSAASKKRYSVDNVDDLWESL
ncbi:MAG: hypothetical protein FGM14_00565 [Flavobacteriales bacterium]|nr:hypothetical protein [Flavobacteriales bacterium]